MRKRRVLPIESVHIDKLVHGGQGMGILADGRKCFVWGALPNEDVRVQLTKRKKDWAEGVVEEIITASNDRIPPKEPDIYLATSPWQILHYKKEAIAKQAILEETFVREGVDVSWQPFYQQANPYHYRNKMEYNFWYDNDSQQVSLALHKRGSHQKIAVTGSALASETINKAGAELIAYINAHAIQARPLKSVIIRSTATGICGVTIFVNDKNVAKMFDNYKPANTIVEIVYSNPNSPASISTEVVTPAEQQLSDTLLGNTFSYSARSFFQVNVPVYEKLLQIVKGFVQKNSLLHILDLYSGVGSLGLSVLGKSQQLTMVEIDDLSCELAQQNSRIVKNSAVVLATAENSLHYITGQELVIVDPPRAGLHKDVVARLIETKPDTILYVSCNPSTQARDVKALIEVGYTIHYAQGFNFFPRTPHIESFVVLNR